jgi:ribosome-associated protein
VLPSAPERAVGPEELKLIAETRPKRRAAPRKKAPPPLAADPANPVPAHDDQLETLEALILSRLDEDKAEDVLLIDLKGKSSLCDAVVIASGRSQRHVSALADRLLRALKENGFGKAQVEGLPHADWVLIDAGDVIVHLFRPEVRTFYNIEKIWSVSAADRAAASDRAIMGG